MQTKVTEMYDRLIQLALAGAGKLDAEKLADALLRVNDFDPAEFKIDEEAGMAQAAGRGFDEERLG